jgi:hypothetical protein
MKVRVEGLCSLCFLFLNKHFTMFPCTPSLRVPLFSVWLFGLVLVFPLQNMPCSPVFRKTSERASLLNVIWYSIIVGQSSEQAPFTSEVVSSILAMDTCGKSQSTLCRKLWVFSWCSGFLPQGKLIGWIRINTVISYNNCCKDKIVYAKFVIS